MARQIASILAPSGFDTKNGKSKYCKNLEFAYMMSGERVEVTMTSVLGHVAGMDFGQEYSNWNNTPIDSLFDAPIKESISQEMRDVAENLRVQARRAQRLVIWTDCDREGEYIGYEIEKICLEANRSLDVYRARYSTVTPRDIHRAMNQPDRLDRNQIAAVAARQEIDLRSGACLTRLQSMQLRQKFPQLKNVISYGSCQFPTLGFVVEQYLKLLEFVAHPFWSIKLGLQHAGIDVDFTWDRRRLFDRHAAAVLYLNCTQGHPRAQVLAVESKSTSRWKPLPLRTVEFQKKASKALKLSSDKLMALAEALYNKGYISYPRTETDRFDPKFDHKGLIALQTGSLAWGQFARSLLEEGRYGSPRQGKNDDKAHPPIHPTKAGDGLTGDEARVYEFVARSYLAACAQDAKADRTTVRVAVGSERFHALGTVVTERNYLDVYPWEYWNDKMMAPFAAGQQIEPAELLLDEGRTSPPQLLTESDLISTMDKNGIGTDATIHEHIKKILERKYVLKMRDSRFIPTLLGLSLVQGYDEVGLDCSLTKPRLRAQLEAELAAVCAGRCQSGEVTRRSVEMYRGAFGQARLRMDTLFRVLEDNLRGGELDPFSAAPLPGSRPPAIPAVRRAPPAHRDDSDSDDFDIGPGGPECACHKPATRKKTLKPGPNQGRFFFSCQACNFFQWADEPPKTKPQAVEENPPLCACGKAAVVRTVSKDGPNKGRHFYCCPNMGGDQCTFFLWKDLDHSTADEPAIIRCSCGLIAVKDTAKSGANAGKSFHRCSKQVKRCTFFQWSDHTPSGDSGGSRCFKCGQEGHYSNACGGRSSSGRGRGRGRRK